MQGPVYWKEQPENHSSSEAVVYCSVVDYLPDRTSFPLSVFVGTTFSGVVDVAIKCHIYTFEAFPRNKYMFNKYIS